MLELVYITVLETVAGRIRGSTRLLPTKIRRLHNNYNEIQVFLFCGEIKIKRDGAVGAEVDRQYPTLVFSESLTNE